MISPFCGLVGRAGVEAMSLVNLIGPVTQFEGVPEATFWTHLQKVKGFLAFLYWIKNQSICVA